MRKIPILGGQRMGTESPACSLIVPVRNESAYLQALIDSIERFTYPETELEVIVVDGASSDGTRERLAQWAERSSRRVVVLDNPERIVPVALNLAIAAATGTYIVRLDAHTRYPSDYVSRCVTLAVDTGADNVGGVVQADVLGDSNKADAIRALSRSLLGVGNSPFRIAGSPRGPAETVPFGCFRRDVFRRFGLFNEALVRAQDLEFNKRIKKQGGEIILDPAIVSVYFNRSSIIGLAQKNFGSGRWTWVIPYVSSVRPSARHTIPMLFVVAIVVLCVTAALMPRLWWVIPSALALYLGALAVGGAALSGVRGLRTLGWFVVGCAASHVSYGTGSLAGALVTGPRARLSAAARRRASAREER